MAKKKRKRTDYSHLADGINWDKQKLGKQTDRSIAKRLGVSPSQVRSQRITRGIPIAEAAQFSVAKGIDWDNEARLGKMYDTYLAEELGCSGAAVRKARKVRDIPTFGRKGKGKCSRPAKPAPSGHAGNSRLGIDWRKEPLGKMLDKHLAIMLGCSNATVALARKELDIPPFRGKPTIWCDD